MSLANERCSASPTKLDTIEVEMLATEIDDWLILDNKLEKTFRFKNFHETMAFANAVAWIAHKEDHHPEMEITFSRCRLSWSTRSANGLSRNDILCAAKVDQLMTK